MTQRDLSFAAAMLCWGYSLAWMLVWTQTEAVPPVLRAFDPIVSGYAHVRIGALTAGVLLFAASPFIREERTAVRVFHAIAIFALIAPGLWLVVAPWFGFKAAPVSATEAILWLLLPLVIAGWALAGTTAPIWPKFRR